MGGVDHECTTELRLDPAGTQSRGCARGSPVVVRPGSAGLEANLTDLTGLDLDRVAPRGATVVQPVHDERRVTERVADKRVDLGPLRHANERCGNLRRLC